MVFVKILMVLLGLMAPTVIEPPGGGPPGNCPVGYACLWTEANYSGARFNIELARFNNGQCHYLNNYYPYTFDTTTSSAYNDLGPAWRLVLWYGGCHASALWSIYDNTGRNMSQGAGWNDHVTAFTIQPV